MNAVTDLPPAALPSVTPAVAPPKGSTVIGTELLQWHDAATTKPDSDIVVIGWALDAPGAPGEWFAMWWDDDRKCWIDAANAYKVSGMVTHWADPNGPQTSS